LVKEATKRYLPEEILLSGKPNYSRIRRSDCLDNMAACAECSVSSPPSSPAIYRTLMSDETQLSIESCRISDRPEGALALSFHSQSTDSCVARETREAYKHYLRDANYQKAAQPHPPANLDSLVAESMVRLFASVPCREASNHL
jgi:hypothetical protein